MNDLEALWFFIGGLIAAAGLIRFLSALPRLLKERDEDRQRQSNSKPPLARSAKRGSAATWQEAVRAPSSGFTVGQTVVLDDDKGSTYTVLKVTSSELLIRSRFGHKRKVHPNRVLNTEGKLPPLDLTRKMVRYPPFTGRYTVVEDNGGETITILGDWIGVKEVRRDEVEY